MKKRKLINFFIMLLAAVIIAGCSKSSNNEETGNNSNPNTIYMKNSVFSNTNLTISVGGTVTWVNDDNTVHTVTANDGSFNSGDIAPGNTFKWTFNTAGTFRYYCIFHAGMTGIVTAVVR